ncbi:hypothetical protein TVAG_099030 [Trichomonas vaginalis G3]|uniref:F5/8 type C domain-containing protein n=1 Tax=Trichomonas vaginalis (strain ATCC PRA-98 / G3) TaxID=412133 RepID=A2EMF4_TRIV3|nr:galactose-binding domain-like family [Trichomonas vaginalis G3]EAY06192.1 hypothetical protein TVAG_099030 [Trichomonas vaginalis G3]KAI5544352.1 galactose-binding domain-like family [Trichomonas vaginalis G3]|eukprot:XP_001318415.1 hypothetical protein [Trichomonas vaginalis G3]
MDFHYLDEYVMLILDNAGQTAEEIIPLISNIGPYDFIHVLRQFIDKSIIHLSIAIVKFKTSEIADKAIKYGATLPSITIMKADPFYLYPNMSLIVGLKPVDDMDYYRKMFLPLGVQSLRVLDKNLETDPFILIAGFLDHSQKAFFKKSISGLIVDGKQVNLIPLRRTIIANCTPQFLNVHNVLSMEAYQDFTIFHFDKKYKVWSGALYSLSTVGMELMKSKPSIKEMAAPKIRGPFQVIVNYLQGKSIDIMGINAVFILTMGDALGMKQLVSAVSNFIHMAKDPYTLISLILGFSHLGRVPERLIDSVAAKFEVVKDFPTFNYLNSNILSHVMSSPRFLPANETSVFRWLLNFISTSPQKFTRLIKNIRIERLDTNSLLEFLQLPASLVDLNDFRLSFARIGLKSKFPGQAKLPIGEPTYTVDKSLVFKRLLIPSTYYHIDGGDDFAGICNYYRTEQPVTPRGDPSITVTASSVYHGDPSIIIQNKPNEWFGTNEASPSWVMLRLNWDRAVITGYSVKTHSESGRGHINNWSVSGSNNGETWTLIDKQVSNDCLNGPGKSAYFHLQQPTQPFKYIKFNQDRANPLGYFALSISRFEIFGSLQ